jgi:hypothetical protein
MFQALFFSAQVRKKRQHGTVWCLILDMLMALPSTPTQIQILIGFQLCEQLLTLRVSRTTTHIGLHLVMLMTTFLNVQIVKYLVAAKLQVKYGDVTMSHIRA